MVSLPQLYFFVYYIAYVYRNQRRPFLEVSCLVGALVSISAAAVLGTDTAGVIIDVKYDGGDDGACCRYICPFTKAALSHASLDGWPYGR